MALEKCPRCDLNYVLDGEKLCTVCRQEIRGESAPIEIADLCSECGENPALPGGDLCLLCLKELNRSAIAAGEDAILPEGAAIEIDSVSTMDEIELDPEATVFEDAEDEENEEDDVVEIQSLDEVDDDDDDDDDEDE